MAELDQYLKNKILKLIDEAYKAYSKESIDETIRILNEAWDLIPEDRSTWDEGYRVAHEFIVTYFSVGKVVEAEKWVEFYLKTDNRFRNFGRGELMAGRIAFELGSFDEAKRLFAIADQKSEGRVWKNKVDAKYFKFYKQK